MDAIYSRWKRINVHIHIPHLFDCSGDALVVNEIVRSYMYLFDISNMNVIPLSKICTL